jgi:hypothetical protein
VADDEVCKMVGLNGIRFLGLDGDRLATIAKRIGPSIEEINGGGPVRDDLMESFSVRSGFLKPYEGDEKMPAVDEALTEDLAVIG